MFHEPVESVAIAVSRELLIWEQLAAHVCHPEVFAGNTFVVTEHGFSIFAPVVAASSSSLLKRVPRRSLRVAQRAESVSVAPVPPLVSAPRIPLADVTVSFQLLCIKCHNECAVHPNGWAD